MPPAAQCASTSLQQYLLATGRVALHSAAGGTAQCNASEMVAVHCLDRALIARRPDFQALPSPGPFPSGP